ncbi:hypothetical protein NCER_101041 [Vairimorpha ceranae BRL01]|uniref:Uncharacterized protein n=2 Tax=Vairimorpha ceranae TaxID=40302 RepID=C4V933_VAIC1|nr:myb-like dna-binding domain protein [Vairimorpha ceranae]EEQ82268.1 hypothetical protein NCER_101041 [Vairimorpha ceranae BRL01]KAF5139933.1 hypothetical protein G9O61_00g018530 [Vairimorpha ceranae]KKO74859.1 myb-like dna-binding domain protein [Vairimorpha ceranae]
MALERENNLWKKSEDDILKMGVMKYGINKWNKVASLLKRTALECKERYENYILSDDNWTEEDIKKLLEISKHLKPQWGLIGKIMNKNDQICYERYIGAVYKPLDVTKHNELNAPTDEYITEEVKCAYNRIKKRINRKHRKNKLQNVKKNYK